MKAQIITQAISAGRRYVRDNPEKVAQITRQAGDFVNKRTQGKYAHQITKAQGAAERYLSKQQSGSRGIVDSTALSPDDEKRRRQGRPRA